MGKTYKRWRLRKKIIEILRAERSLKRCDCSSQFSNALITDIKEKKAIVTKLRKYFKIEIQKEDVEWISSIEGLTDQVEILLEKKEESERN